MATLRLCCAVLAFLCWTSISGPFLRAQDQAQDSDMAFGLNAFGSYQNGNYDSVDVTTGKLNVHIPLWSYPQVGGKLHLDFSIHYDSPTFYYSCPQGICDWFPVIARPYDTGTVAVISNLFPSITFQDIFSSHGIYMYSTWTLTESDGATHHMADLGPTWPTYSVRAIWSARYFVPVRELV
jgi:hypothetical protein